jgi:hypothetical protein
MTEAPIILYPNVYPDVTTPVPLDRDDIEDIARLMIAASELINAGKFITIDGVINLTTEGDPLGTLVFDGMCVKYYR